MPLTSDAARTVLREAALRVAAHVNDTMNPAWDGETVATDSGKVILAPGDRSYDPPKVIDDWHGSGSPAVCWEEGPYEWAYEYTGSDESAVEHARLGVFVEPWYTYAVLVTPAEW